jgi:hypothetical protein
MQFPPDHAVNTPIDAPRQIPGMPTGFFWTPKLDVPFDGRGTAKPIRGATETEGNDFVTAAWVFAVS